MVCPCFLASIIFPSFSFRKCWDTAGILIPKISLRSQGQSSFSSSSRNSIFSRTSFPAKARTCTNCKNDYELVYNFSRQLLISSMSACNLMQVSFVIVKFVCEAKVINVTYLSKYLNININNLTLCILKCSKR